MFWLKTLISGLLMPLSLALMLGVAGGVLARSQRCFRRGRTLLTLSVLLLLAASNRWISGRLIAPLERLNWRSKIGNAVPLVAGALIIMS